MAIFADRVDAGERLAIALGEWSDSDAVVFGVPRGGVVVAAVVARALRLPLSAVVVRKLGSPSQPEYALGAIAEGVRIVDPEAVRRGAVTAAQLALIEDLERVELRRREQVFESARVSLDDRVAIIVDDGVATGASMIAACQAIRIRGASGIVVAVPVAPLAWRPGPVADRYVCPHRVRDFVAVGQFYDDFTPTTDAEVEQLLAGPSAAR